MTFTYKYWEAAITGKAEDIPLHDGDIHLGFWRKKNKDGSYTPAAIWLDNDQLFLKIGNYVITDENIISDRMSWLLKNPITHEAYKFYEEHGRWPDDAPNVDKSENVASIGHNNPPEPIIELKDKYEEEKRLAVKFMKEPITTQEQADSVGPWAKRITEIAKEATKLHKDEKAPFLEKCREIDEKWRDLKEYPGNLVKKLKKHVEPYLLEQARKAREEQERLRREAEEKAKAAQAIKDEEERARAEKEAAKMQKQATAKISTNAGRTGQKVSLRTVKVAVITDQDAFYQAVKDRPETCEFLQSLADKAARMDIQLEGMIIQTEEKAA
jgi:vacuolar-type H+-ATPase subunit H